MKFLRLLAELVLVVCQLAVLAVLWHLSGEIWDRTRELTWPGSIVAGAFILQTIYVIARMPDYLARVFSFLSLKTFAEKCQAISGLWRISPKAGAATEKKFVFVKFLPLLWSFLLLGVVLSSFQTLRQIADLESQILDICRDKNETEKSKVLVQCLIAVEGPYLGSSAVARQCSRLAGASFVAAGTGNSLLGEWIAQQGLQYCLPSTSKYVRAGLHVIMAKCCEQLPEKLQSAEDNYKAALAILENLPKDKLRDDELDCLIGLSRVCRQTGRYEQSLQYSTKAVEKIRNLYGDSQVLVDALLEQCADSMACKNYDDAEKISAEALSIAEKDSFNGVRRYRDLMPPLIARQDVLLILGKSKEAASIAGKIAELDRKHITAASLDASMREQILETVQKVSKWLLTMQFENIDNSELKTRLASAIPADFSSFEACHWYRDDRALGSIKSVELNEVNVGVGPMGEDYSVNAFGKVKVADKEPEPFGYSFSINKQRSDGKPGLEIINCRKLLR